MKKILVLTLLAMCAMLGLWACGEGSLEHATDDDFLNVEKIGGLSKKEIKEIIELCKDDKECLAEYEAALVEIPPDLSSSSEECDEDDEDCEIESSSSECDEDDEDCEVESSSSSECDEDDEDCEIESSSSECDEDDEDCEVESSSSEAESSSSDECEDDECDAESSSSEAESSSSECGEGDENCGAESSSSEPLKISGKCVADVESVEAGTLIEWTYVPDEGSLTEGLTYEWTADGGTNEVNDGDYLATVTPSAKFKFDESSAEKEVSLDLLVVSKKDQESFTCAPVLIEAASSSSEGGESSSSENLPIEGTCKPNKTTAYTYESVVWTYTPAEGSRTQGLEFDWFSMDAAEGGFGQTENPATFVFAKTGKMFVDLSVNETEVTCDPVTIEYRPAIIGTCTADKTEISVGESVTWTFNFNENSVTDVTFQWTDEDASVGGSQTVNPVTMTFTARSDNKTYYTKPTLTVSHSVAAPVEASCDQVKVVDPNDNGQGGGGGDQPIEDPDDESVTCTINNTQLFIKKSQCEAMGGTY